MAMNVALTIQDRLKDLRVDQGLTLEQLEQPTGIQNPLWETMKNGFIYRFTIIL